ncbi:MAG TPA: protein kinase [Pyrinomonadaceae bacterium]|nr:protein kinase [Pyrinomonadaceae bacterium]
MTTSLRKKLGAYEIRSKIGEGGMGEVYRAYDEKLNRDVAIKVLPSALSADKDRLARFEQEAQAAGALNHPNVLVIYHIEAHGGSPYMVSELLEGQTLRERMNGTALPQRKAVDLGLQIARGLAAAHEKGIVHRDIKPENIFITNDGRVKILDFGLAKLSAEIFNGESQTEVATRKVKTDPGTVMGTIGYMSPEQVRGQNADARSDIFSFGAVFYEMLSGMRAFNRNSTAETISAILKEDPPDLSTTNKMVSQSLERLVNRCLEKNPEQRFHSASDLAFAIESLSGMATDSGQTATVKQSPVPEGFKEKILNRSRFWMASTVILALALFALAMLFVFRRSSRTEVSPVVRYDVPGLNKTALSLLRTPAVALSPDGSTLAFLANSDGVNHLYLRKRDDTEIKMIPGTEGALDAAFSPDGQWIAFIADFTLKKVPLNGPVVSLANNNNDPRGVGWINNDTLVYAPAPTGSLFEISANGGEPRPITTVDEKKNERTHRWPQALPGGKAILFTVGTLDKPDDYESANIEAVIRTTGEQRLIVKGASMARYVPSGHLIFAREGILYAVAFDVDRLTVRGQPVAILTGVAGDRTTGAVHFSAADDGTLAYVPGSATTGIRTLVWVDKGGNQTPVSIPRGQLNDPQISPDGSKVALLQGSSGSGDVWIYDFTRSTFTRFTFTNTNATPIWSADSKNIYYVSITQVGASDQTTIMRKPADGSHEAETILTTNGRQYLKAILRDGETALLDSQLQTTTGSISKITLMPGAQVTPVVSTPQFNHFAAAVSSDGRWLAYQSNESGRPEIYVRDFAEDGGRWQISTGGGQEPHWSPEGRELYYRNNGSLMVVPIETKTNFQAGTPKNLFGEVYDLRSNTGETFEVDPSGGRFLLIRPPKEEVSSAQVRIVLNWFSELQRLVPVK